MVSFASPAMPAIGIKISLSELLTKKQISELQKGEPTIFSIPINDNDTFSPRYAVTTKKISLGNLQLGIGDLKVIFEHQGRSILKNANGVVQVYSHQVVRTLFQTDSQGNVVQDGRLLDDTSKEYVGVAPYGPWRVKFEINNPDDIIKIINTATLNFDILGRIMPIKDKKDT